MAELVAYPGSRLVGSWTLSAPTVGGTGSTLSGSIDSESTDDWIDFGQVANNSFEVFELDLSALPVGALITSLRMEFEYRKNAAGAFQVAPCGISDDGTEIVLGSIESTEYGSWNNDIEVVYPDRFSLSNGAIMSDFTRLGFFVRVINGENAPGDELRLNWGRCRVQYDASAPLATITNPANASTVAGLTGAAWTYSQPDGRPQTHYQVKVFADGDGAAPDGVALFDTGKVQSASARSVSISTSLESGDYDVFVRVWSTSTSGAATFSDWASNGFTVGVPAEPPVAPLRVTSEYDPETASATLDVVPVDLSTTDRYEIERSSGGSEFEPVAVVEHVAREAALLRFDAGALAYVSTPEALSSGQFGIEFVGRIRNVDGQNQPVLYAMSEGVDAEAVRRGAAVAARADSFYDTRYRDGSGDLPCRNGSGRLATKEGDAISLDHDGTHWVLVPGGDDNLCRMNLWNMDVTSTVVTLKGRVRYRGDSSQAIALGAISQRSGLRLLNSGAIYGHIRSNTNTHFPASSSDRTSPSTIAGLVAGDIVDIECELNLAGGEIVFRYAVNAPTPPDATTMTVLDTVTVDPDTLDSLMTGTDYLVGKTTIGSGINTSTEAFYAGVFPNIGTSLEFYPDRDYDGDDNAWTDSTSGEEWEIRRELTGFKTTIVTAPVELHTRYRSGAAPSSGYWNLDPADVPTFTKTSGKDTRVVFLRRHESDGGSTGLAFSAGSARYTGLGIYFSGGATMAVTVRDAVGNNLNHIISGDNEDGVARVVASVIDGGAVTAYNSHAPATSTQGAEGATLFLTDSRSISDVLTGDEPAFVAARGPRISGSSSDVGPVLNDGLDQEVFASLNFGSEALTQSELEDLTAFLEADRRIGPFAPTTFLALLGDGRIEAQIETASGVQKVRTLDPVPSLVDGDLVWIRATYYPSVGAWIVWYSLDGVHDVDDVTWIVAVDDSPDGSADLVTSAIDLPIAVGPASDPAADLDVFHAGVAQSAGVHSPVSVNVERDLPLPLVATSSIAGPGGELWTLSEEFGPGSTGSPIELVVTESATSIVDYPPLHQLAVYRARSAPADGSPASGWISADALGTNSDRWWLMDSGDLSVQFNPSVASYSRSEGRVTEATELADRAVAATSGPLSDQINLSIRVLNKADRDTLRDMLRLSRPLRVVDIWGEEWWVKVASEVSIQPLRLAPENSETTGLRDAHMFSVSLVEVARPT